ncbi:SDR family oxidoreductase [Burkholderia perseverans]|uniref:SDR family oxidoreductase n=1 Tax=Burkholderia perseverans TaxID=2615214 RepID=UPI001FF01D25|nr:SDR family oxidoreductase [Burkholderia perseverans]
MDLGLNGRTALVMGGGGGLGRAIATALAREGANLVLADLDEAALRQSAQAVEAAAPAGVQVQALHWDLAELDAIDARVAAIEARFGGVDVLVNNTGGPPPTPASGQAAEAWRKYFDMMVLSVIAITDRVLPGMRERRWGRVITSASSGVIAPIPNLGMSNALRASLVGWSKTLAREVARDGITANVVVPGRIATDRIRFLDEAKARREGRPVEAVAAESTASIPLGRYGEPAEYADAVAFLASARAAYITGSVLRVDGGLIASI